MSEKKYGKFEVPDINSLATARSSQFDDSAHIRAMLRGQDAIAKAAGERVAREKTIAEAAEHSLNAASVAVDSLFDAIEQYEVALGECEELAIFIIGGPAGKEFFPNIIRPLNPDKVMFGGLDENDRPFTVVQHVSQLNFAMLARFLQEGEKPRRVLIGRETRERG